MTLVLPMAEDPRPIESIYWEPDGEVKVGRFSVTKILPYVEGGRLWLAVYGDDPIAMWQRIPAYQVSVVYK